VNITPGARGCDLTLNHHRYVHLRLGETTLGAVEHGAAAKQRGPAPPHRINERCGAAHIEERLVHPRERSRLGVLRRCGGANRNGRCVITAGQLVICLPDRILKPPRQRFREDHLAHPSRRRYECRCVVNIKLSQLGVNPVAQTLCLAKRRIGRRADDESLRDGQAGARQLAEIRALAAREVDVCLP
jgi:hypothetical protein